MWNTIYTNMRTAPLFSGRRERKNPKPGTSHRRMHHARRGIIARIPDSLRMIAR